VRSRYTGLDLPHYGHQHNYNWPTTKNLPPIRCMPPLWRSGRFPALSYPAPRHCIEYSRMLSTGWLTPLPLRESRKGRLTAESPGQRDKSMKYASPPTFGTVPIRCRILSFPIYPSFRSWGAISLFLAVQQRRSPLQIHRFNR
jgi:hypothetical protein